MDAIKDAAPRRGDPRQESPSSPQVKTRITRGADVQSTAGVDRAGDVLLTLEEVCSLKRTTAATERWLRHRGEAPYLWRSGRRLVAWRLDVLKYLEAQRSADQADS